MRQQRPRGTTTRESVVNAALDVVDDVGFDDLTIRAVATAVSAPPMSLYTHFANKEELLDLMYLEVSHRLYPDSGEATWQAELVALSRHVRATLLAHPRWTPILSRPAPPAPPSRVSWRERLLKLMVADGLTPEDALGGLSSGLFAAIGQVLLEVTFRGADGESTLGRRFLGLKTWFDQHEVADVEPTTRQAFAQARAFDMNATFEFMLQTLIAGLEHRRKRTD
jgi:AcrR family transcriptional regulator